MSAEAARMRILVVDDHPLVRSGFRGVLRMTFPGAEVGESGSAADALERVAAAPPDLVLVDIGLPDFSGVEVVRRIRATGGRMPILVVAGEADGWTVREAMGTGANGFVMKTISADAMRRALVAVLAGEEVLCDETRQALERVSQIPREDLEAAPGPAALTARERQVLARLAEGLNTKTVADELGISVKTVETHRAHLARKLGSANPAFLARYAVRHRLLFPGG